jgi:hypothetical protein
VPNPLKSEAAAFRWVMAVAAVVVLIVVIKAIA